ncbi:hypothetical protein ACC706_38095, partial [Rhizobium johnstonii]
DFFSASIADTIAATLGEDIPEPDIQAHAYIFDAIETGDQKFVGGVERAGGMVGRRVHDRIIRSRAARTGAMKRRTAESAL